MVVIIDPSGDAFQIGGYNESSSSDVLWSYWGGGSNANGYYSDSFTTTDFPSGFASAGGTYSIYMENDWSSSGNVDYNDFTIAFQPMDVPEPGTLAVISLGLIGLGIMRRKRAA